jgi:hypothetical protein
VCKQGNQRDRRNDEADEERSPFSHGGSVA